MLFNRIQRGFRYSSLLRYFLKRSFRQYMILGFDVLVAIATVPMALLLRLGEDVTDLPLRVVVVHTGVFSLIALGWYLITLNYTRLWRTFSFSDFLASVRLCFFTMLTYIPMFFSLNFTYFVPRSMPLLTFFAQLSGLMIARYTYLCVLRLTKKDRPNKVGEDHYVILGDDDWLEEILHKQQSHRLRSYNLVGIVHKNKKLKGRTMYGVPVLGSYDDLESIIEKQGKSSRGLDGLLIADTETLTSKDFRRFLELASLYKLTLQKLLPQESLYDRVGVENISVEDLLGREEVSVDDKTVGKFVENKVVLVTGAGGSIGGELARQLASFHPSELILLDSSEYSLYMIDLELSEEFPDLRRQTILADVTDKARINEVFGTYKPSMVCHAAALKHVPMVELNPLEGVRTNVIGTRVVADACVHCGVQVMVMISTDKAVNPANIMGASKRLAESYCQALDAYREKKSPTRFVTVRFGNVLGSTGSVVPLFQRQIAKGGPVTITHPDMVRYFMTIQEAVSLVLKAATLDASVHHEGSVFVLDMGQPVSIATLARQMILLSGRRPGEDITIVFTGIRPGEKLYEELFYDKEIMKKTDHPKIFQASPGFSDYPVLADSLDCIKHACQNQKLDEITELLAKLVPEYKS